MIGHPLRGLQQLRGALAPQMRRAAAITTLVLAGPSLGAAALVAGASPGSRGPAWAYPEGAPPHASGPLDRVLHLAGTKTVHTEAEVHDRFLAVDWGLDDHPPMPGVVGHGHPPDAMACAFCHLPNGEGRPENATLAGLPASYIEEQVQAFRTGARTSGRPGWTYTHLMQTTARAVSPQEIAVAARYFAHLKFTPHVRVVEAASTPRVQAKGGLYQLTGVGGREPLDGRIVETPDDGERFEMRDDRLGYVAYVPIGAVARGRRLASGGNGTTQACGSCHGADLTGGVGPPIAGRSPSYIVRQLDGFATGARSGGQAEQMKTVVAKLSEADFVDLAAYVASRRP